jgi:hypothetical protein
LRTSYRRPDAARRRSVHADDAEDREPGGQVVVDLASDLPRQPTVAEPGVPDEERHGHAPEAVKPVALRAVRRKEQPLEDASPGQLLRAGHLHDPDPGLDERHDQLADAPAPARAPGVAGVLVQQAVRQEHDPPAPLVLQLPE